VRWRRQPAAINGGNRSEPTLPSKTLTTPLITTLFGRLFKKQLIEGEGLKEDPYQGCGKCKNCKKDACGRYFF
jgi:hypothetical protein